MNPFNYQGPVSPDLLIDRRDELRELQHAAANRVAVRLAAPRRWGKTSVLDAHVAAMRAAGHHAITVDFSKAATVDDVLARVTTAYAHLPKDPAGIVARWAARLNITVGGGPLTVGVRPRVNADEARGALLDMLDLPKRVGETTGDLTVVCFDEFQDILIADETLDGLFRSVIQHHGDYAAYVFAGSAPTLMRELFADSERPFYGQARPLTLTTLPFEESLRDIEALLADRPVTAAGTVARLLEFSGGHPQRTMLLAHHLYDVLDSDDSHDDPADEAVRRALTETEDVHQAVWDRLDRLQAIVVVALADGRAPTGAVVAREHRVARSSLESAIKRLVDAGDVVTRETDGLHLLDPLFAEWLRRRGTS